MEQVESMYQKERHELGRMVRGGDQPLSQGDERGLQFKVDELQRKLSLMQMEHQQSLHACKKRAELDYDERQALRDEKIKQWLDSQVLQHLFKDSNS